MGGGTLTNKLCYLTKYIYNTLDRLMLQFYINISSNPGGGRWSEPGGNLGLEGRGKGSGGPNGSNLAPGGTAPLQTSTHY